MDDPKISYNKDTKFYNLVKIVNILIFSLRKEIFCYIY